MKDGIMDFSTANFIAIIGLGITMVCLLMRLVWQASIAVTEIKRIGKIVEEHEPKLDNHEARLIRLESTSHHS